MKIKITVEWMPIHVLVGGVIFAVYGFLAMFMENQIWIYALVFLLGVVMVTSRHLVVVDPAKKQYSDFYWVLGFKVQNYTASYENILCIILNSGPYTQKYGMYVRRYISGTIYKIYLDLDNGETVYLGQHKDNQQASAKAEKLAGLFNVKVRDLRKNKD